MPEKSTGYLTKTSELTVHVLAKPAAKLRWLKDNKELMIKDRLKVETKNIDNNEYKKEHKLIIENVQANDSGKYKLEASNKCSTEFSQTEFEVKGMYFLLKNLRIY